MSDDIKVKGFDALYKRNKSSIINKDEDEYQAARKRRQRALEQDKSVQDIAEIGKRTTELENKLDDIQDTLSTILKLLSEKK